MAKKDNGKLILAFAIVLAALIIAPNLDFSTTVNQQTLEQLETAEDGTCSLSLSKNVINAGDSITGKITDGANTLCSVYGNLDNINWIKIGEGTTNALGEISVTDTLNIPGDFEFRAICGSCVTNTANLVVNPAPTSPDCTDTDGINKMTAGWVTYDGLTYYDKCVDNVVTEYYCDGDVRTRILPCDLGYECVVTRSGGYCNLIDDGLEPGDELGGGEDFSFLPAGVSDIFEIYLDTEPGDNPICAEIEVESNLFPVSCIPGMPIVRFDFSDSTGIVWTKSQVVDFSTYGNPDVIHVSYDGQTPFRMVTTNTGFCDVNAKSRVKLVVCE